MNGKESGEVALSLTKPTDFLEVPAERVLIAPSDQTSLSISFRCAGIDVTFLGLRPADRALLEHYRRLSHTSSTPDAALAQAHSLTVHLARSASTQFKMAPATLYNYACNASYDASGITLVGVRFVARITTTARASVRLIVSDRAAPHEVQGAAENVLRVALAHQLCSLGGLLLHSAAIVIDGAAHLLIGASGSGKTTASRLALDAGHHVLSDDLNAVAKSANDQWLAWPVPFAGELRQLSECRKPVPLSSICRLHQATETRTSPLSPSASAAAIYASSPSVNANSRFESAVFDIASSLLRNVRVHLLDFTRSFDFIEELRTLS